ncbi:hypothetical protein GGS26DRAFT_502484 [Hypomontagnella submonticulosa]|nr:hypothetical protein GGS26DRAFT_502484 [Hypomontagnella submonticulosa]
MEQPGPSTPTDTPAVVPRPSTDRATDSTAAESSQSSNLDHSLDDPSNSVPSLRFPRPLGNRQLTNWISSSSPDIMQPETFPDDDPSLAELGYDVIGTDGESQAESIASSLDYQRPDDIQSLAGTDTGTDVDTNEVDTDSSDDEEGEEATTLDDNETPAISAIGSTIVNYPGETDDEDADVETLANQSLENPTDFSQHGISLPPRLTQSGHSQTREVFTDMQESPVQDTGLPEEENDQTPLILEQSEQKSSTPESYRLTVRYVQGHSRILVALSGLAILYSLVIASKGLLFSSPTPKVFSTVPVASVSSAAVTSSIGDLVRTSLSTPTSANTPTQKALQTSNTPSSLMFMGFGKDKAQTDVVSEPAQSICSAELWGRNEIMVKIPQNIKATWLLKDAILIAVSRGLYDIPTKVSSVEEGFLIEVPLEEAHDVLAVTIATTSKPKIREAYRVDFGRNKFIGALDAGKQLVKDFAQKLVDTVNETTAWVEETYIPALDVMSKQVCSQTSSVSDSLLQGLRDAGDAIFSFPSLFTSRVTSQMKLPIDSDHLAQRQHQAQLQLVREAQDLRDELALRYVSAQLRSKLLWLQIRGKTEEYQRYLSKAEIYLKEKVADAKAAKKERAEHVKKQIRSRRKHERRESRRSFWNKGKGSAQA